MLSIIFVTSFQLRNIFFPILKWREQFSGPGTGTEALCYLEENITQRTGHSRRDCDELDSAMMIMVHAIIYLQASIVCHLCAGHSPIELIICLNKSLGFLCSSPFNM